MLLQVSYINVSYFEVLYFFQFIVSQKQNFLATTWSISNFSLLVVIPFEVECHALRLKYNNSKFQEEYRFYKVDTSFYLKKLNNFKIEILPLEHDMDYWMNEYLRVLLTYFVIENSCWHY